MVQVRFRASRRRPRCSAAHLAVSPPTACAIIASEDFIKKHNLQNQAIEIVAQAMTTDSARLFNDKSAIELTGADMTRKAAQQAYKQAGISPSQLSVIELHDCCSSAPAELLIRLLLTSLFTLTVAANELLVYDALGLTELGKAHSLVRSKDNTFGGRYVINPSGGLESKGHPLGATGLGMAFYLVNQLRGWAGAMQMEDAAPGFKEKQGKEAYALAHNLGLGGSCVVTILKRPSFFKPGGQDGRDRLGYNHGVRFASSLASALGFRIVLTSVLILIDSASAARSRRRMSTRSSRSSRTLPMPRCPFRSSISSSPGAPSPFSLPLIRIFSSTVQSNSTQFLSPFESTQKPGSHLAHFGRELVRCSFLCS